MTVLRAFALMALYLAIPAPGHAQIYGEALGDLYLTTDLGLDPFDPVRGPIATCIDDPGLPAFETLGFFLVIALDFADVGQPEWNATHGLRGWEARVHIPQELTIIARTVRPRPCPLDMCLNDNFIVGIGITILAASTPYAVVEYDGILLQNAQDVRLTLGASTPSSFDSQGGPGPVPGWLEGPATGDCLSDGEPVECLRPFRRWQGCANQLVLNYTGEGGCAQRCAMATNSTTWSSVKSRY
jgi:hypothetical protein